MQASRQTIWRLVETSANELTNTGFVPFTRGDLIKLVKRKRPNCGEDSINPIIQGVTDNLRGGAPGAVGKNILHSVGRGQFILADGNSRNVRPYQKHPSDAQKAGNKSTANAGDKSVETDIGGYRFSKVCDIEPQKDSSVHISELLPQGRYENLQNLPLNKYGSGPFCKFKIPSDLNASGVYALVVNRDVKYIGECIDLSSRYNMGYGNISPRNCFVGGQETNCRVNHFILMAAKTGEKITLWFFETENYKVVEGELRATISLDWNRM